MSLHTHPSPLPVCYRFFLQFITLFIAETIEVECDMSSVPNQVITIIHNNLEAGVHVTDYEAPDSYQRDIQYTADWSIISSIKNASKHCEQYFKFECVLAEAFKSSHYIGFSGQSRKYSYADPIPGYDCLCRLESACIIYEYDEYVKLIHYIIILNSLT